MRGLGQRFLQMAAVLLLVAAGTFFLLDLMPGSPAIAILGTSATPEGIAKVEAELGLDKPSVERFLTWGTNAARGDLGVSYRDGENVAQAIRQRFPTSFEILILTQLLALSIAVPAALFAAARPGKRRDRALTTTSFALIAIPQFVMALTLLIIFAKQLQWFPAADFVPLNEGIFRNLRSLVLPVLSLGFPLSGIYFQVLRNDLVITMSSDHIMRTRASGFSERIILLKYALRSSSLTLLAVVGLNTAGLLGGVLIIEQIYSLPGLGRFLFDAATRRDIVKVEGAVLVIAVTYVIVNLIVDMLLRVFDPRVRAASIGTPR